MATIKQIIDQAERRLNELDPARPERWDRYELLLFLNDALTELNLIAAEIQRTVDVNVNSTNNIYSLPSQSIAPMSLRVEGYYPFKQSIAELDAELQWEGAATKPRIKTWCPFGLTQFLIHPRPPSDKVVKVEYLSTHLILSNPESDLTIEVRPEYEPALEDFVVHRALFKEGGNEFQQGLAFYTRFLDAVQFLAGVNVLRRYPAWDIAPETEISEVSGRETNEGKS